MRNPPGQSQLAGKEEKTLTLTLPPEYQGRGKKGNNGYMRLP
jgi:hypothetical protein